MTYDVAKRLTRSVGMDDEMGDLFKDPDTKVEEAIRKGLKELDEEYRLPKTATKSEKRSASKAKTERAAQLLLEQLNKIPQEDQKALLDSFPESLIIEDVEKKVFPKIDYKKPKE
jgi:hypothetical protein